MRTKEAGLHVESCLMGLGALGEKKKRFHNYGHQGVVTDPDAISNS